jgi:hypothetical protein
MYINQSPAPFELQGFPSHRSERFGRVSGIDAAANPLAEASHDHASHESGSLQGKGLLQGRPPILLQVSALRDGGRPNRYL